MKKQTLNLFISIFILAITGSCKQDTKKMEAEKIVAEWIGKTVIFPDGINCTSMGKDTICPDVTSKPYKVLLFTDSVGCTSCKLQLHRWSSLIESAEEEVPGQVNFLLYFQPKDEKELKFLLKRDNFKHPVFIDSEDKINKANNFPSDENFQCYLLNEENKVVAIGNPISNPKIWELYKQIITGEEQTEKKTKISNTQIEVEQTDIEFKDLQRKKTSKGVFVLKNIGDKPLIIKNIDSSCGCTVPKWDTQPIKPGDKTEIEVEVTPDDAGFFQKSISVYCNIESGIIKLSVKGMAKE